MLARWNGKPMIDWNKVSIEAHIESQQTLPESKKINSIVPFAFADMPIPFKSTPWTIEISNLSPEMDEPALKRLLTSRLSLELNSQRSEVVENSTEKTKRSLFRQRSFQVSFSSELEMKKAMSCLQESVIDGLKLDVE